MRDEFEAKEWAGPGGVCGELAVPPAEPPRQAEIQPAFPPPPWSPNYVGDEPLELPDEEAVDEAEPVERPAIPRPQWAAGGPEPLGRRARPAERVARKDEDQP